MTLNALKNIDFAANMDFAWFAHFQDHIEIVQAVKRKKSVKLTQYAIFPFNRENVEAILLAHQLYHDDMNGVLKLNGTDLQQVDLQDKTNIAVWTNQNFQEHYSARQALGI